MQIKVKKLTDNAVVPTRGSDYAAGYDLYATETVQVNAGETAMIHTGIALEIPEGYFGAIYARSGLAANKGLRPANCVGVIDSDYRGEIMVAIHNDTPPVIIRYIDAPYDTRAREPIDNDPNFEMIEPGDRVAQLVIQKFETAEFVESSILSSTARDAGGFGSSGQ